MSDQYGLEDTGFAPHDRYIPALDGLRGVAAMLVAGGHYMTFEGGVPLSETVALLTGLGMTLFFVLSGFVIHYNYNASIVHPGGTRAFFAARFARLYPLYILVFLLDFAYTTFAARDACDRIGMPEQHWLGLVSYLTLTQSWFYVVICRASLAYQYGPVSAVTWSISIEIFFYLVYAVVAMAMARRRWSARNAVIIAGTAYGLVVGYFLLCGHYEESINRFGIGLFGPVASTDNGYENSLLRWLFYFNPAARLGEFFAGMAAAQLCLGRRRAAAASSATRAAVVTLAAIVAAVAVHLWLYGVIAPHNSFIGRTASPLYGPLVAIAMYLIARYNTPWSRLLALSLPVQLGESSYSIYLLHEIIPSAFKRLDLMSTDVAVGWVTWVGSLILLALVSMVSYAVIERPARTRLRALLMPRPAAAVTTPGS